MKTVLLFIATLGLTVSLSAQNATFKVYNQSNVLIFTTNSFKQVAVGKDKHIWVGTNAGGLYKFNGTTWVKGNVLLNHNIRSITRAPDSSIVIGQSGGNGSQAINGGVSVFSGSNFNGDFFTESDGLSSRFINAACVTADGTIFSASGQDALGAEFHEGGIRFKIPGAGVFDSILSGLPPGDIRVVTIACGTQEVWAGLDKSCPSTCSAPAILRYSTQGAYLGSFTASNTPIPFALSGGPLIRAIGFTPNNIAWVGFHAGGLAVHQGANWYMINSANSKFPAGAAVNTNSIKCAKNGKVYIGTTAGLLVYKGGSFTDTASYILYTTADGLPSNSITGIETYSNRTIWLTTTAGVVKMKESFLPELNGWRFANTSSAIWPASWYSQYNYSHDPYLGGNSFFPKRDSANIPVAITSNYFPDWNLFVETLGEDQCYQVVNGVRTLRIPAVNKYLARLKKWGGSCNGFVQSSFMAWDSVQRFKAVFPSVGAWAGPNHLYNLQINDHNRKCINKLAIRQRSKNYFAYLASMSNVTPNQTLNQIKEMLDDNTRDDRGLLLYNQNPGGGAHIVNPFDVETDVMNSNLQYIRVYDNNYPGITRTIIVNTAANFWLYNASGSIDEEVDQWGGMNAHKGLYLSWPSSNFYNQMNLDSAAKMQQQDLLSSENIMELFNVESADILISNAATQSMGFQSGLLSSNIPDAFPMLEENGRAQPPYGYYLPEDAYTVKLSKYSTTESNLKFFNNTNSFGFSRIGATLAQEDHITISTAGIMLNNPDNTAKVIGLNCAFEDAGNEMSVDIQNLGNSANGNAGLLRFNATETKVMNLGAASQYDLKIRYLGADADSRFAHDSIDIAANTVHVISPDWVNLKTAILKIFVDNGNNGSYEDTLYFGNAEPARFLCDPNLLKKSYTASVDTIHLINVGGGSLNWSVASSDTSWLKIIGNNTGINSGFIVVSTQANPGGARTALLSFQAGGAEDYVIDVAQSGILSPISLLKASDGSFLDGIHVAWTPIAGATHYKVYRSANAGATGIEISNWISDTSFVDLTANKGQFYYYRIKGAQDMGLNASDFSMSDDGWRAGFTPDFNYTGDCSGQPTSFSQNSNTHSSFYYLWDINNDGSIDYAGSNVQHTFPAAGSFDVKLTVTDSLATTESIIKTILIKPFPVVSLLSDTVICSNQSIVLNAGTGFDSYLWSTGATTPSITVDSSGYGLGMSAFSVKVITGNVCSAIKATHISWDTCVSAGSYTLSGQLTYDNNASTILNNASVLLKQGSNVVQQTSTDAQGNYLFNNVQTGDYLLTGASDKAWGGVNSTDALKVTRYFVGLISLPGVRGLAADVNGSGFVNAADGLLVAKRFVGINNSFLVGDWAFATDTVHFSGLSNQTSNLKAVVYGDVDGSYIPPAKMESSIVLANQDFTKPAPDGITEIPLSVTSGMEVGAVSLVMQIPDWVTEIVNVSTAAEGTLLYHVEEDALRIAWYSLSPMKLEAGKPLLSIFCRLNPEALSLDDKWIPGPNSQLADESGIPYDNVTITLPEVIADVNAFYLGQNIPNPFTQTSEISWFMPEQGTLTLKVINLLGQEVLTLAEGQFVAGLHQVHLNASDLQAGTYNYRIEIHSGKSSFTQTKKLVLIH